MTCVIDMLKETLTKMNQQMVKTPLTGAEYEKQVRCLNETLESYANLVKIEHEYDINNAKLALEKERIRFEQEHAQNELELERDKFEFEDKKLSTAYSSDLKKIRYDTFKGGIQALSRVALVAGSVAGVNNGWLMKTTDLHVNDKLDSF